MAVKFFNRVFFRDATVSCVPTPENIQALDTKFPATIIVPQVREGMRLSELPEQDSYSYALAYIYMGARNQSSLLRNYACGQELAIPVHRHRGAHRGDVDRRSRLMAAGALGVPHRVTEDEIWIQRPIGCRPAAQIWRLAGPTPVPSPFPTASAT
jgi:hypothetical protein